MVYHGDEIKIQDTIQSLVDSRNKICEKIDQVEKLLLEINQEYKKHSGYSLSLSDSISNYSGEVDKERLRRTFDFKFWEICFDISMVEKFISSKEKSDMRDRFHDNPPVFEYDSAVKLIHGVMNSTEALASNLIRKIYSELTNMAFYSGNHYRSKKQVKNMNKIEKSFRASIFSRYGIPSYVSHRDSNVAIIQDLERVCYLVDGKIQPSSENNIISKIESGLRSKNYFIDSEYFTMNIYKNGNVKIDFKDINIVKRINLWGSKNNQLPNFSDMFKK